MNQKVKESPMVPYRAWQFHALAADYVSRAMKRAPGYGVNTVVFSHGMIGAAAQLFDGSGRGECLRRLSSEGHELGLKVWLWVHELEDTPDRFRYGSMVDLDRLGFWEWLAGRYERVFREYPEFDGLMLTLQQTEHMIFDPGQVRSEMSMPERLTRMVNTIERVCTAHDKLLIVRTFAFEPREMRWLLEGLRKAHPSVMIQTKCVPHDWDAFYPHAPLIGMFPERQQIIEFDGSSEYTGKNRIPYACPDYFEYRWRYALDQPGVAGYNIRLDHGGYDALFTPNEINIYALSRFTEGASVTADQVWKEWTQKHYGERTAPTVERALRSTFETVNKSFYALRFWITDHSRLPSFGYATHSLYARSLAKWYPNEPEYATLEEQLKRPDLSALERIIEEKDAAVTGARAAVRELESVRELFDPEKYDDLHWRLVLLERTTVIWRLHAEALFGILALSSAPKMSPLREQVVGAVGRLREEAVVSERDPRIGELPPGSGREIREAADELEALLRRG